MYSIGYFDNYVSTQGHIYSCDMIRLKFEYHAENEGKMLSLLDSVYLSLKLNIDCQEFQSFKSSGYRWLFVYSSSDKFMGLDLSYTFTIGAHHNMDTDKNAMTGFIEFNPNKCNLDVVRKYMLIIRDYANYLGNGLYFDLIRFDMAIDIKLPRYALKLIKEGKRMYKYIQSTSLTEYLGVRHSDGSCKLYDKKEESKLNYDLTRLEITCTELGTVKLPKVACCDGQYDMVLELSDTDFVLVTLIRQQEEQQQQYYLSKLGRKKRDKLRPYIIGGNSILEYDKKGIFHVQNIVENAMKISF